MLYELYDIIKTQSTEAVLQQRWKDARSCKGREECGRIVPAQGKQAWWKTDYSTVRTVVRGIPFRIGAELVYAQASGD